MVISDIKAKLLEHAEAKSDSNKFYFLKHIPGWSTNNDANGMVFWFFIKRVDQGLLPSERGLILQEKDIDF